MSAALRLWQRLGGSAPGRWLASRLICFRAPYFASIRPLLETLEPGRCVAVIADRRAVHNHIGTVHAIALCNLAEFTAGLATDAAMRPDQRWIPKGMTVEYLKKARGRMRGEALVEGTRELQGAAECEARVSVRDPAGEEVFRAVVRMWVSPKPTA